jgi:hypothetical protein
MPINQLFSKKPDNDILEKLLSCFNLKSLQEEKQFTKKILKNYDTVKKIEKIADNLKDFYIPCKGNKYLTNLNEKKVITILRQIIKCFNYFVFSKEKYIKGEKNITYQIMPINQKEMLRLKKKDEKYVLSFD